jgi:NADPH2:quinone reductase
VNWNGRILVVGFASGIIPKYPTNLALLKGCQLVGVFFGEFLKREPQHCRANCAALFELYAQGKLKPLVGAVFPLDQFASALNLLINRQALGKIVLRVRGLGLARGVGRHGTNPL